MSDTGAEMSESRTTLDRVLTVLLLAGLALVVMIATVFGGLTGMASDGCTESTCNYPLLNTGVLISTGSPSVVGIGALILVVRRWTRGRTTWWVPLAAVAVMAAVWLLGAAISEAATN